MSRRDRDGELVEALRRREPRAAERLLAVFGKRAYRLAIRITGNAQDAEEVVQDAFLAVVRKIETFRADSALRSWLYRIVANAAYQKLRAGRGRRADRSLEEALLVGGGDGRRRRRMATWSLSLDDPSVQTELRAALTSALNELPEEHRAAVLLHDVQGFSTREISEALRISIANVKSRLHRARLFLRARLGDPLAAWRRHDRRSKLERCVGMPVSSVA